MKNLQCHECDNESTHTVGADTASQYEYCDTHFELYKQQMKEGHCMRLYDENGDHVFSILPCIYCSADYDLARPNGEVFWCERECGLLGEIVKRNAFHQGLISEPKPKI